MRVPDQNFQTAPTITAAPRFENPQTMGEATLGGQNMQQAAQGLSSVAQGFEAIEVDRLEEANRLRVIDTDNALAEFETRLRYDPKEGYERLKGFDALNRPDGVPLTDEYAQRLQTRASELSATLGNDAQRQLFDAAAKNRISAFKQNTTKYEGEQYVNYQTSVRTGTIKNRTQLITLNYNNPQVVSSAIADIEASARDLGRQQGKSAAEVDADVASFVSAGHMSVIETALAKGDARYADNYFKANASRMDANSILRVNTQLNGEFDKLIAQDVVTGVMTDANKNLNTSESDRAFNLALGAESSNMQFGGPGSVAGPNEPTTSPKGAIGVAQVMPDTAPEAAKLAGLEWDEQRYKTDASYNRALGKAYFDKQLKDFGSLAQAYAAYNAGPGAVRKAIEAAAQDGPKVETVSYGADGQPKYAYGPQGSGDWMKYLPEETRNYVNKNMKAFDAGQGQNARPSLVDVQNAVRAKMSDDNPQRLRMALDLATKEYEDTTKALKQQSEQGVANAMREVMANGGSYNLLPADIRSAIPPEEVTKVMDFAKRISTGDDTTNLWLYNKFESNPQALTALTDDQFFALRSELSDADYKYFSKQRGAMLAGNMAEGQDPGKLNSAMVKSTVDDRLRMMGIDPSPEEESSDAERVGGIRKFINEEILRRQQSSGKKFNDLETIKQVDDIFAKRSTYEGYIYDSEGPMLQIKASNIPSESRTALKNSFRKKYGVDPSDNELVELYWRMQSMAGVSKGSF